MDSAIYNGWKDNAVKSQLSAVLFNTVDFGRKEFAFDVYSNDTLTTLIDVPAMANAIGNAIFRKVAPVFDKRARSLCFHQRLTRFRIAGLTTMTLVGTKDYPTPELPNTFDIVSLIGPGLYMYIFQLLLPVFLGNLVHEKETKLREIMRMMGLKTHIYCVH